MLVVEPASCSTFCPQDLLHSSFTMIAYEELVPSYIKQFRSILGGIYFLVGSQTNIRIKGIYPTISWNILRLQCTPGVGKTCI